MNEIKYVKYFDIDPRFFPAVNAELIEKGLVKWENFYPHETFVKLLEKTHDVLSGRENKSIWVEGAYGTGKSHAVLTVKSILEATDNETRGYFEEYGLDRDLCNKIIADKSDGRLLTVHRIGSSDIRADNLVFAVQESIIGALEDRDEISLGDESLREAALRWLKDKPNHDFLDAILESDERYAWINKNADDYINILSGNDSDAIMHAMKNIQKIARDRGFTALQMTPEDMGPWIESIIKKNNLSAILFVWDEFSEFFYNNINSLTGFQTLAQISFTIPFYFMIVTHQGGAAFESSSKGKDEYKKISGRFTNPIKIELPENMAFKLMAQAMKKTKDETLLSEWNDTIEELNDDLEEVRIAIKNSAKKNAIGGSKTIINDDELKNIIPIHPYAALVLKNLAVMFSSNQRSMFDFIINDDREARGFKHYIKNFGPDDDGEYLLTVEKLWDFFTIKGQSGISTQAKNILDSYFYIQEDKLTDEERRVFKTVLILEAISAQAGNVDILRPNPKNIDLSFIGTGWDKNQAKSIADKLCTDGILASRNIGGGEIIYTAARNTPSGNEIEKYKADVEMAFSTKNTAITAQILDNIQLKPSLKQRFIREITDSKSFRIDLNKLRSKIAYNRFKILYTVSKNEAEATEIKDKILNEVSNNNDDIIFVDLSLNYMGKDLLDQYIENSAYSRYYSKSDRKRAVDHDQRVNSNLMDWRNKIAAGSVVLYNNKNVNGKRLPDMQALNEELQDIDRITYKYALELYHVGDNLFNCNQPKIGAECAINGELKSLYKSSNKDFSLDTALKGAWGVKEYWKITENRGLTITNIKNKVDGFISEGLKADSGRVSMESIFDMLMEKPFGILPNNLSAFILGFVLKEYTDGNFYWSDGQITEAMTVEKLKNMIHNIISYKNQLLNGSPRKLNPEYIVEMSVEQKMFLQCARIVFKIPEYKCSNIEQSVTEIRLQMKKLTFPIWCTEYIIDKIDLKTKKEVIIGAVNRICSIANTSNITGSGGIKSANIYAEELGGIVSIEGNLISDLAKLITDENCRKGMLEYISIYKNGELKELASEISDMGEYINHIKGKFNSGAANWLWNRGTADEAIDSVILEYKIIRESNKYLSPKVTKYSEVLLGWKTRLNNIKLPYAVIHNKVGDMKKLLELMAKLKKSGIIDQEKISFYEFLVEYGEAFAAFYSNQLKYFKIISKEFFDDVTDEDINSLYNSLPSGQFVTCDKTDFYNNIDNAKRTMFQNQAKKQMMELWLKKTGTSSPIAWSDQYSMPIFSMFSSDEINRIRVKFKIMLNSNSSEDDMRGVISFLENATFYDRLADQDERDTCFMKNIVGEYCVMLKDVEEIKTALRSCLSVKPYYWLEHYKDIQNKLRQMSSQKYKLSGYREVMNIINNMDAENLRKYLINLVEDNLTVGMEILRKK